jgi:VanZ family protein
MTEKTSKVICFIWAAWIFGSSCTVITRQQFVTTASVATRVNPAKVAVAWESIWWVFVKGYHVLEFMILTLLLVSAFKVFKKSPWLAALVSVFYAATDEWHQTFVPHRGGHISDVLIDSLGIALAMLILVTFRIKKQIRKRTKSRVKNSKTLS